ncbi:MAG: zinc ribbon domain-containing protein [Eubacteriaceae bacterium]|nr:zinc ribbon domain-containing protein [Eubacteriaceae bacterium]
MQQVLMSIVPGIMAFAGIGIFVFAAFMMFSPALRGRMLARQFRSMRYATDLATDDIRRTGENMAGAAVDTLGNIIDEKGERLQEIASKTVGIQTGAILENKEKLEELADLVSDAAAKTVSKAASALQDGTAGTVFCKYCGTAVDADSVFCKKCGKKL